MSDSKQPLLAPSDLPPSYEDAAGSEANKEILPLEKNRQPSPAPGSSSGGPGRGGAPLRPFPLDLPILRSLRSQRVILASASPRRRALLAQIGLTNVEIMPSSFAEDFPKSLTPFDYVLKTAHEKCTSVYTAAVNDETRGEPALVLAADTVVVSATGAILEKPRSEAQHRGMLRTLRDSRSHSVVTAVVAMAPMKSARDPGYVTESHTEETKVTFGGDISDEMLDAYVRTREGADKAGGYGIQGIGAILVDKIEGSYDNVVGLPIRATLNLIQKTISRAEDEETLEGELDTEDEEE